MLLTAEICGLLCITAVQSSFLAIRTLFLAIFRRKVRIAWNKLIILKKSLNHSYFFLTFFCLKAQFSLLAILFFPLHWIKNKVNCDFFLKFISHNSTFCKFISDNFEFISHNVDFVSFNSEGEKSKNCKKWPESLDINSQLFFDTILSVSLDFLITTNSEFTS